MWQYLSHRRRFLVFRRWVTIPAYVAARIATANANTDRPLPLRLV